MYRKPGADLGMKLISRGVEIVERAGARGYVRRDLLLSFHIRQEQSICCDGCQLFQVKSTRRTREAHLTRNLSE